MGYKLVEVKPGVWELVEVADEGSEANKDKAAEQKNVDTIKKLVNTEASAAKTNTMWSAYSTKKEGQTVVDPFAGLSEADVKTVKDAALKRLMKDLKYCQENPLPTVNALPLENDMFTWHANLLGSSATIYGGLIFHMILEFPITYPHRPPKVKMCTFIDHPNIFGGYICLDMLEQGEYSALHNRQQRNTGWTTAYSVQSILVQLQNFLSHHAYTDRIGREWGLKKTKDALEVYSCTCGHGVDHQVMIDAEVNEVMSGLNDYDPQKYKNEKNVQKQAAEKKKQKNIWKNLNNPKKKRFGHLLILTKSCV